MLPSVRVGKARIASFLQFQLRDVCMICQPPGESAKQLPADFRDWIMARTFEIGAEIVSRPDRRSLPSRRCVQGAVIHSDEIKSHLRARTR